MSYNDLPENLKACFMSSVIFQRLVRIPVGKLIRYRIATRFLYSGSSNDLEGVEEVGGFQN